LEQPAPRGDLRLFGLLGGGSTSGFGQAALLGHLPHILAKGGIIGLLLPWGVALTGDAGQVGAQRFAREWAWAV
jgi:hypothetical protein